MNNTNVNTNIRPISNFNTDINRNNVNRPPAAQKQEFSIRMVLDPNFATKYGRLSDESIRSIEVDAKRESLKNIRTRQRERVIFDSNAENSSSSESDTEHESEPNRNNNTKQVEKTDTSEESPDEEEEDKDYLEAISHIPLRLKPTRKFSSASPYAPRMADTITDQLDQMEIS